MDSYFGQYLKYVKLQFISEISLKYITSLFILKEKIVNITYAEFVKKKKKKKN